MNRPIRVLELRSVAGTGGGPDKTLVASADLRDPDVDLTLCYLCNEGDDLFQIGAIAKDKGLDYVEVRERGPIDLRAWRTIRQLARERRFDIAHGHDYKTDLFAWMLGRAEGVIPFATAHGWTGHNWKERTLYYPVDKRLLAHFPRVVAVSGEIKQTLVRAGGNAQKIDVILNGIDPHRFRRFGLAPDDVVIGAVGRLEPQKRFDLLIDVVASLLPRLPNLKLMIGGEGSLRPALEEQIRRLKMDDRVRLAGQVDVIPFHHALDLFVQSSDYEGTPNVVLEAMAMETPVVATDVGGTSELAQHDVHALIVRPSQPDDLRNAITAALSDPVSLEARARAARARVETDLAFSRRIERLHRVYNQLLAENQISRPGPAGRVGALQ
jgi:glycosyltransferase involved in cell wall biosynthesis